MISPPLSKASQFNMAGRLSHILALLLCLQSALSQLYEGEPCRLDNGIRGVCRSVPACPGARDEIASGNLPKVCSFANYSPIVCCADNSTPTRRPPNRPTTATTRRTTPTTWRTNPPTRRTNPTTTTTTTTKKPALDSYIDETTVAGRKCREYGRYVYWERELPVLTPIREYYNETECYQTGGETLIVGGVEAEAKEFPHMVALGFGQEQDIQWKCGGSLISERFVLTAGHCLSSRLGPVSWGRLGDLNINSNLDDSEFTRTMRIVERIKHEGYKPPAHYNDIALLKLESDVTFSPYIRPACLFTKPGNPFGLNNATATGWGKLQSDEDTGSDKLMKVILSLQGPSRCNHTYRSLILFGSKLSTGIDPESMICAGDPLGKKDTCGGDSGGPLQIDLRDPYCMYSIIGLTSFGVVACGLGDNPAVYTRVSNYIPWIERIVWPNN